MNTNLQTPRLTAGRKKDNSRVVSSHRKNSWLRLILLAPALLALSDLTAAANTPPPVVFSVEPEEDGKLVYLPIAPATANDAPGNLFGLRLLIANNASEDVRLKTIRITFTYPDNATFAHQFSRDGVIGGGKNRTEYLTPEESIQLSEPAPTQARIDLFFDGYTLPKTVQRQLAPYEPPVPGGKYLFPGNSSDLGPDEYFSHKDPHTGGSQFFGYDFHVTAWNGKQFSSIKKDGDPNKNEDRVGWNIPIYSMADGVVLRASLGWEDNPAPGKRSIQRMGEAVAGPVTDVQVAALSETRAATVARLPDQSLEITVWDLEDDGRILHKRGTALGESATLVTARALTASRLATAFRTSSGHLRLVLWNVSADGQTITRLGERDGAAVQEISLVRLSNRRFATAARNSQGNLRLNVWEASSNGLGIASLSQASAGTASSVSLARLTSTRLATSLRDSQGKLKLIVWDLLDDAAAIARRGDATDAQVTKTVAAAVSGSQVDTAMRTAAGNLRLVRWTVSNDGQSVSVALAANAGAIQDVVVCPTFQSNVITTVITGSGNLKHILWNPPDKPQPGDDFIRWGESGGGPTNAIGIDQVNGALHLNAIRTASGNLKVIAWFVGSGGGNSLVILHGNCRVLYAHFKEGTVNPAVAYAGAPVAAGQFLGRMGNSGSSGGPHLHIHAERVSSLLSLEEMLALEAANDLPRLGYRPIPFYRARAKQLSSINPGGQNAFSTLNGQGVYFTVYGIRPTWLKAMYVDWSSKCLAPAGQKDCVQIGLLSFGGPFPKVNQALNAAWWGQRLFIRAGSYNETIVFDRAMTVRSYDGTAILGK